MHLLAPAVGLSAQELAEAFGLRLPRRNGRFNAPPPPAAPRVPPSTPARKLLCMLMQRPALGGRIGHLENIEDDPWLQAVQAVADCVEHGDIDTRHSAGFAEHFRDGPHGPLIEQAIAAAIEDPADEGALPHMFDDTLQHLRKTGISRAINHLTALSRQAPLSAEQQAELGRLLREKART
jgi:DNA primase